MHDMQYYTLMALVQDRPGVLSRTVNVFRRRRINIESLTVARTDRPGISKMTWVVEAAEVQTLVPQLEKLIDVLEVRVVSPASREASESTADPAFPVSATMFTQADGVA